uniref:ribonuclease H n=1 Tax=Cyprinus carpio TaxID=7962 RepID=A0A8C1M144_CYPCA
MFARPSTVERGTLGPTMEEVLQRLAEVSIRQQQIVEHLATRQGRTEEELAAVRTAAAQRVPLPDPRAHATRLLPKMTADDDVEAFLQVFENTAQREAWPEDEWARALAPLLTGEAQRAYFSLPGVAAEDYHEVKREILARLGLSSICAAQQFHEWEFKPQVPARAQAAELSRIAQHWLLEGSPTAAQVAERVVVDRLLRALPRTHRQAVGMRNPTNTQDLVEAIELADAIHHREAGDRAPPFPRRVVQARRPLEGAPRPVSRPMVPPPRDEPMPSAEPPSPPRAWLAGCIVHQRIPSGAPRSRCDGGRETFPGPAGLRQCGHPHPVALLDVAREAWEQQPAVGRTTLEHIKAMRERIDRVMPLVREHMSKAQQDQQRLFNRAAQPREFQPGDYVMVLVPTSACKFLARWQGPYTVTERVGPVTYKVRQPGRRKEEQLYHINLLKRWVGTGPQLSALATTSPVVVGMDPNLSAAQKTELQHLVGQFLDVFSPLPGRTTVIQHEVRTPPGVIVRQRPYRVPEARRHAIETEVQEMLKLGVIEPSRSPWSSPIVMVPKPDGTLRFCNDFRRLNEVSEFDGYPMPRVDELLDRLGRARFISTLDLTKGYWQVPLSKDAKPKTAFSTPSGHWQYRVLPFGLHGAPATFQRLMDVLLRPHMAYAAAYIDDVVIHSETWGEHLERLRRVLLELRRAGLTANPRKCHLALSEAKYLGFCVGRGLIRPQENKVTAILSAPRPTTKTQVRAFLGLAGYYRCFIPNFSSLAAPLTDLTRKGQPEKVCWTPSAEEAFGQIKTALTSAPVLRAPDFSCPFLLQTDASDAGLGAVLSQVQEGEEHPVIYISRKLSPAERNYAVVEKEALAIKWAVLELRYYLLGRKFTLVTDHAPLQWMARSKDTNARVTRWFLALQDFHFEVRHRAGAANANADGLSRIWTAYAGLSGVISRPPLTSPLLSPFIRRTRTTLRGGGCDERPRRNQRRPGNQRGTPARPHRRLISHCCSS